MVRPFLIVVAITLAGMNTSQTASAQSKHTIPQSAASPPTSSASPMVSDPDGSLKREAHVAGYTVYAFSRTVVWGMLTTSGTVRRSVRRQTIYGTHMVLSIMALSFTALHAMSHLFKKSNPMSPLRELVPFMSEFHVTLGLSCSSRWSSLRSACGSSGGCRTTAGTCSIASPTRPTSW